MDGLTLKCYDTVSTRKLNRTYLHRTRLFIVFTALVLVLQQLSRQQTRTSLQVSGTPVSNPARCPTHTDPILTDRLLPVEPGRVIGIQDHLDDRGGWPILARHCFQPFMLLRKFPETHGLPFAQRERGEGRECYSCRE